jgi:hypothetical protein
VSNAVTEVVLLGIGCQHQLFCRNEIIVCCVGSSLSLVRTRLREIITKKSATFLFSLSILLIVGVDESKLFFKASSPIQVKLWNFQSTIPMVVLRFTPSRRQGGGQESTAIGVEELKQANVDETTDALVFEHYHFDEDSIVRAVIDLFHRTFKKDRQLGCLEIYFCHGRVDEILHVASSLDMFDRISLVDVDSHISHRGLGSISVAMNCNTRLTRLDLMHIEMTKQKAAALGAGLVTSNSHHFKELRISYMTFADGAITELASGLKQNSSLCLLNVHACNLEGAELAELVGAMESHPSLKKLSLWGNKGQKHALVVALGKVLASRSCRLEELEFFNQGIIDSGFEGWLGSLAQGLRRNESLRRLDLSCNGLLDKDIDQLGQSLTTCKLEQLILSGNRITYSGFVSLTQNIPKSLKQFRFYGNDFEEEEAACHMLTLFEEHPQLWEDGFNWNDSKSPIHQKIQHFKDLNRCGRILLLARDGEIPLSVWPLVLARANTLLSDSKERTPNVIFNLLQGPALMQRRFDRDSSQATCGGTEASERLATSSKRGPAETIDQASAKKERSE